MIPFAYINEWRDAAPWDAQVMVEQDLIISRIVVDLSFQRYMAEEGRHVTGDEFRANLAAKLDHPGFAEDCAPLLKPGTVFDPAADAKLVEERILSHLPDPKDH